MTHPSRIRRGLLLAAGAAALSRPSFAQPKEPIRIGFSISQSGAFSAVGKSALIARQLWCDDVNARGGLLGRPVKLVFYDDQSNPSLSPGIYAKLIDLDKANVLWLPYGTPVAQPVMPLVVQRQRLALCMMTAGVNDRFKYDRFFQVAPFGDVLQTEFPAGFTRLAARKGYRRMAMITADSDGLQVWADSNRRVARKLGIEIVYDQKFAPGTLDFSSMFRAMNALKPDAVYIASYPNESVAAIRAIDEIGVANSVMMLGGSLVGLQNAPLLERLGTALNGITNFATYVPGATMDFTGTQDFFQRYSTAAKAASIDPLGFYLAQFAYAQGQVTEQAIRGSGSIDSAVMARWLHANELDTVAGKFRYDAQGEWTTSRVLQLQFRGIKADAGLEQFRKPGTQVLLDPPELANGDLKTPFALAHKA